MGDHMGSVELGGTDHIRGPLQMPSAKFHIPSGHPALWATPAIVCG